MSNPPLQPPRFATALLRACCSPERLEEIEGDMCELFAQRSAREGVARARRRYAVEACSVSSRQLAVRGRRALRRTVFGPAEVYPLRVLATLVFVTVLLMSSDRPWAVLAWQILLGVYGLLELTIYARGAHLIYKRWRERRRVGRSG